MRYLFLALRIRISEILHWDRKSFLSHWIRISEILPMDGKSFLAHRIRISEILPWDRKSYLTHAILPKTSSNVLNVKLRLSVFGDLWKLF